jgi:hypothetical protein
MPAALEYKNSKEEQSKPKATRKPRVSTKGVKRPKMPEHTFKTNDEFHAYLDSLTHTQLKSVVRKLISATKKELKMDIKASTHAELLEDAKDMFSYKDYGTGGQFVETKITTFKQDSLPAPKPRQPRKPKEDKADRVEPLTEKDYPTSKEVVDERIRKQIYGKMRIIEQTTNDIYEIQYKNKKNKTTESITGLEERRKRAEDYIKANMDSKLSSKFIRRALKKAK